MFSCNRKKNISIDDSGTIISTINMNDLQAIKITQYIDSVNFIKLETNADCLIGNIKSVFFIDNCFFIQDSKTSSILVFNRHGNFLHKINKKGRGPGEYIELSKFMIDKNKKNLLIYDGPTKKMLYYSFDGKFIKEISDFSGGDIIRDIINIQDGNFLCYTPDFMPNNRWGVWQVDETGKPGDYLINQDTDYPIQIGGMSYFYELPNDQIGLWCPDLNDIFHFDGRSVEKYMSMKPSRKTVVDFPEVERGANNQMVRKYNVEEKGNFLITEWIEGINYLCTSIYLKNKNETVATKGIEYANNIGIISGMNVKYNIPNQQLSVLYPHLTLMLLEVDSINEDNKRMISSMFKDEGDNPVLQIMYVTKSTL
ncbi:MAG: 6-bladed beta-propeller [Bacteroidales bacterium]|jgi:hypothetical protein|nr:6-bladed beta-propeller [Bacteroidales bacterium]